MISRLYVLKIDYCGVFGGCESKQNASWRGVAVRCKFPVVLCVP